jgi:hypothetical protein
MFHTKPREALTVFPTSSPDSLFISDDEKDKQEEKYVIYWFHECVKGSLADFCPEYSVKQNKCRRFGKFKKACPLAVPPRKLYMFNGHME